MQPAPGLSHRQMPYPSPKRESGIRDCPRPTTKKQVRAFLGLAGYYWCFIPSFTSLACALTDLTKKGQPDKIQCSPVAKAFHAWRLPSLRPRFYTPLTFPGTSPSRQMPQTPALEQSCHKPSRGKNIRWHTLVGSSPHRKPGMVRLRRKPLP